MSVTIKNIASGGGPRFGTGPYKMHKLDSKMCTDNMTVRNLTSMKEMMLNPRQSPKRPPREERKPTQVIRALLSISESNPCSSLRAFFVHI